MEMEGGGRSEGQAPPPPPHIVSFPGWGMSHIIPHAQLVKSLVLNHGFTATIITACIDAPPSQAEESFLSSLPAGITSIALPPVNVPRDLFILNRIFIAILKSLPALRDVLHRLKHTTRLSALIIDPFCADALDVAREVGVPAHIFFTSNLYLLSLSLLLPAIHEVNPALPDVIEVPGCPSLPREDFPDTLKVDIKSDVFTMFLANVKRYREAQGILVNTFPEFEPGAAAYCAGENTGFPPLYLVGPLLKDDEPSTGERAECLKWLDRQPTSSVVYINFGSMALLTYEQMTEMAHGLEKSGQRFLWVIRPPVDKARFRGIESDNPLDYLPEGFAERTAELGFLLPSWAPQVEILKHPSTEGFLTHCGWNSTIETLLSGVAMIAWPIYAEQAMNAIFLAQDAKIALRSKRAEDGIVKREEIAKVVKELMEGERGQVARENVRKLKKAAEKSLAAEEGNSYKVLKELADKWKEESVIC